MKREIDIKENQRFYLIGIKGTGMAALAEILLSKGVVVTGSDVDEKFYTNEILDELGIPFAEGFSPSNLSGKIDAVVRSAAYTEENNPEVAEAIKRQLPMYTYTEVLGALSRKFESVAICGVHGKTTTTSLIGTIIKESTLPASVVVGSAVANFGNRSTLVTGDRFLIAETCEYRRHFLDFSPSIILLTSVEPDHLDYFKDYNDIRDAFVEFCLSLPPNGELIYCFDDPGAAEVASIIKIKREDIKFTPYGKGCDGDFKIIASHHNSEIEANQFTLAGFNEEFTLHIPGEHTILNSAGTAAVIDTLCRRSDSYNKDRTAKIIEKGLSLFNGSKRRSEILGIRDNILFMDDYAHHPTAIKTTLQGIKNFYPNRRLIVDFMSHTYTRTAALFNDFAGSFSDADVVILHKIYPSARETYNGSVTGESLFKAVKKQHSGEVYFFQEPEEAIPFGKRYLKEGDLFISMGAGNNRPVAENLLKDGISEKKI